MSYSGLCGAQDKRYQKSFRVLSFAFSPCHEYITSSGHCHPLGVTLKMTSIHTNLICMSLRHPIRPLILVSIPLSLPQPIYMPSSSTVSGFDEKYWIGFQISAVWSSLWCSNLGSILKQDLSRLCFREQGLRQEKMREVDEAQENEENEK